MDLILYPPSPEAAINPTVSDNFRRQAWRVVFSIFLFFIVYLLLVVAVVALAFGAFYLGVSIIFAHPSWLVLLLGTGIIATGVSLFFFIVKFVAAKIQDDNSSLIELKEEDEPKLFEFLRTLTAETGTSFPNKIFLSQEVNAAVSRKIRFWNMVFPAKKDLIIGAGLVNTVSLSEFKAVMAHEFGHFSQHSIKLGSFIYNVNRVIHNLLYENSGYVDFINQWGRLHGLLSIFAHITVWISQFIQWILRGMYMFINKHYMGLSREMEYNADEIAATVAGGNNLISALYKMQLASYGYDTAIQHANGLINSGKKIGNIYAAQIINIKEEVHGTYRSRINFKNQWASHPTTEDREGNLARLNIHCHPVESRAWILFKDPELLQKQITANLYASITFKSGPHLLETDEYHSWVKEKIEEKAFPAEYLGFYSDRYVKLTKEDIEKLIHASPAMSFNEIFTEEHGTVRARMEVNLHDIQIIEAIAQKHIKIKSFDFDGVKYQATDAQSISEGLKEEISTLETLEDRLDRQAFLYFHSITDNKERLRQLYLDYISKQDALLSFENKANEARAILGRISEGVTLEQAEADAARLKRFDAEVIKPFAKELLEWGMNEGELKARLTSHQSKSYAYFFENRFMENEISDLQGLIFELATELEKQRLKAYREMLNWQANDYRQKSIKLKGHSTS